MYKYIVKFVRILVYPTRGPFYTAPCRWPRWMFWE